jgi:hypothetical protein
MKMKLLIPCVIFLLLQAVSSLAQQTVFINEAMASNDTTIADATGDYADWIELYNSSNTPLLLDGYYISNDINDPLKFRFSGNLLLPANGYLILWASTDTLRGNTHLPFKVSASGEKIYLFLPDGVTLVDFLSLVNRKQMYLMADLRMVLMDLVFLRSLLQGASNNNSTGYAGYLNAPVFSVNAGFYANPVSVAISSDDPGAQIIYTMDGSIPDAGNIQGTVYRYRN